MIGFRDRSFITSQGGGGFDRGVCFLTLVTLGGLSFNIFKKYRRGLNF